MGTSGSVLKLHRPMKKYGNEFLGIKN